MRMAPESSDVGEWRQHEPHRCDRRDRNRQGAGGKQSMRINRRSENQLEVRAPKQSAGEIRYRLANDPRKDERGAAGEDRRDSRDAIGAVFDTDKPTGDRVGGDVERHEQERDQNRQLPQRQRAEHRRQDARAQAQIVQDKTRKSGQRPNQPPNHAARPASEVKSRNTVSSVAPRALMLARNSSSVPSAIILPRAMMPMRSASRSATSRICVVMMMVAPARTRSVRMSFTCRAAAASRPVSGSSSIRSRGSWMSAPASASFCRSPRENPSQRSRRFGQRPKLSSRSSASRLARRASTAHKPATNSRYSSWSSLSYSIGSSGSQATIRLASIGAARVSIPKISISPSSAGRSPATRRNVVVFPAPLGPSSA